MIYSKPICYKTRVKVNTPYIKLSHQPGLTNDWLGIGPVTLGSGLDNPAPKELGLDKPTEWPTAQGHPPFISRRPVNLARPIGVLARKKSEKECFWFFRHLGGPFQARQLKGWTWTIQVLPKPKSNNMYQYIIYVYIQDVVDYHFFILKIGCLRTYKNSPFIFF